MNSVRIDVDGRRLQSSSVFLCKNCWIDVVSMGTLILENTGQNFSYGAWCDAEEIE